MPRPRKPAHLLELSGAWKKNPQRRRPHAPRPVASLGPPPARLPVEARKFWRELARTSAPGVLTIADRWAVELCARLMEKAVRVPNVTAVLDLVSKLELSRDDARAMLKRETISGGELSILRSLLGSLGMTRADREKLSSIPTEKPKNKFAELAERAETARDRERRRPLPN